MYGEVGERATDYHCTVFFLTRADAGAVLTLHDEIPIIIQLFAVFSFLSEVDDSTRRESFGQREGTLPLIQSKKSFNPMKKDFNHLPTMYGELL